MFKNVVQKGVSSTPTTFIPSIRIITPNPGIIPWDTVRWTLVAGHWACEDDPLSRQPEARGRHGKCGEHGVYGGT